MKNNSFTGAFLARAWILVCAFALVFAIAAATSCGEPVPISSEEDEDNIDPGYAPDGRKLYNFTVKTSLVKGSSRALTSDLAHNFDYYEVVFKVGNEYKAKAARRPSNTAFKISIPPGTYPAGTGSILLAGMYNNNEPILLAVGEIGNGGVVSASDTSINFTLYSLRTNITDSVNPSFEFVEPLGIIKGGVDMVDISRYNLPYWKNIPDYLGSMSANFIVSATQGLIGVSLVSSDITGALGKASLYAKPLSSTEGNDVRGLSDTDFNYINVNYDTSTNSYTHNTDTHININIDFNRRALANSGYIACGLGMLDIRVPVSGLNGNYTGGVLASASSAGLRKIWYIQNGISRPDIDSGLAYGTGILIELGNTGLSSYSIGHTW